MNTEREHQHEQNNGNRKNKLVPWLIVLAVLLLLSIIGNIIYMTRSGRLASEKEVVETERDMLQEENQQLRNRIITQDAIIVELNEQIEEMIEIHGETVADLERRIANLHRQLTARARELEELEETNDTLRDQLTELQSGYEELQEEKEAVEQERDRLATELQQLTEQAEAADRLRAYNICTLTRWDRWLCPDRYNVDRARRVDHTYVNFEVDGTLFTRAGERFVHLLMLDPDGNLMYASDEQFTIEETGEQSPYTKMRRIDYTNEPVKLDFNIVHPERLDAGTYELRVYVNGEHLRSKQMELE